MWRVGAVYRFTGTGWVELEDAGKLLTRDEANTRALPRVVAGALRLVLALRLCRCGHRFCYEHSHPHPQGRFYKKFEHPVCPTRKQFRDFSTDIVFALIS